jgi:hypothetical protein
MLRTLVNRKMAARPSYLSVVIGSVVAALLVALGTVGAMKLLGMEINAAIPAALGAVAAATWAVATMRRA